MENLRKRVKMFREKMNWSQQTLATKAGLSYNTITQIEQGRALYPNIRTIVKIADAYGITIDKLIGRSIVTDDDIEHALFD